MRKSYFLTITICILLVCSITLSSGTIFADETDYLYLGGQVIGINVDLDELFITSKVNVLTKNGAISPLEDADILMGDILYSINDIIVRTPSDIENILNKDELKITVKRGKNYYSYYVKPALDLLTKNYKLGLLIQDKITGIGTITYIDPKNLSYAALGHPIRDFQNNDLINKKGSIFSAKIASINKPSKNRAGELNGIFNSQEKIGSISRTSRTGIYGNITNFNFKKLKILKANKSNIKTGPAKIYSTIDQNGPKYFDIEILKINFYDQENKNFLIKITDKNLLSFTNGILQGMSGSPIIQDGKIIGAVTHVFVNDPTRGYGIFIEEMLGE